MIKAIKKVWAAIELDYLTVKQFEVIHSDLKEKVKNQMNSLDIAASTLPKKHRFEFLQQVEWQVQWECVGFYKAVDKSLAHINKKYEL